MDIKNLDVFLVYSRIDACIANDDVDFVAKSKC